MLHVLQGLQSRLGYCLSCLDPSQWALLAPLPAMSLVAQSIQLYGEFNSKGRPPVCV